VGNESTYSGNGITDIQDRDYRTARSIRSPFDNFANARRRIDAASIEFGHRCTH
jgi:hypothetical protein